MWILHKLYCSFYILQKLYRKEERLYDDSTRTYQKVLKYTKGNKTETSRLLGIGLTTLYRKIEEYGL